MAGGRIFPAVFLLGILAITIGCASEDVLDNRLLPVEDLTKKVPNATYVVDPPDALRIEFLAEKGMDRNVVLRSDGCVTLTFLEDVEVAGLTTVQIREKLEKLYSQYFKEPKILVTVTAYRSKHIYLDGEVGRRGSIPYTGTQTVMDALGSVGGVTRRAARTRVKVTRGDADDPEVYRVNLKKLMFEGDLRQNILLAEDDVIYVPPTVLAWIGYRIDDLLFPFRSILAAFYTGEQVESAGRTLQ